jgi:phage shock protein C
MTATFALDETNAKLMGVCSGFARWMDVDPALVRVTAVLLGLIAGPALLVAYVTAGLVAESR